MDQKTNQKGNSKTNDQIKRNIYTWITRHPQVVQSPIFNDFLKVIFDDQIEPQLVPNILMHVSLIELHYSLVSYPNDGGIKYTRGEEDYMIMNDSTLRSLLPPQLNKCHVWLSMLHLCYK